MNDRDPVVIAARRSPIGEVGGALRNLTAERLAAPVLTAALHDSGLEAVDDVLLGNVMGPGGNPARVAALRAGFGVGVPGMTVDRQCASGLSSILVAAAMLRGGAGEHYLAGGVESASTAPWRAHRPRSAGEPPRFYSRAPFAPADLGDPDMGPAADVVAAEAGISRERQDEFAARSHARAVAAQDAGRFDAELVDVGGGRDERPRRGFGRERLARFRPAFTSDGTATAANSCGVSDGAAAVLITTERERRRLGVPGLRLVAERTAGVDPSRLGLGAVPALRHVLRDRPVPELVEFTEAFAGQVLACVDAARIDERGVSPDGGAIALGHPWGASGAVLVVRLFSRMVRENGPRTGVAALSSGGGLGVATVWERVD
ncbi:thiolase family protein [Saccharopolyspora sp. NFXS83]|uniref:thiolase family protein n=1 Tax=Saccharopolyspora sp. NFXS83 TaxID=2993560 RepID=UPI00224B2D16|nr:thiolase family protein [Saccharopolyspora sp. NFXS83]MCX2731123.1 thiolase family protein [Saccharopolyspora sp. NFXS83]